MMTNPTVSTPRARQTERRTARPCHPPPSLSLSLEGRRLFPFVSRFVLYRDKKNRRGKKSVVKQKRNIGPPFLSLIERRRKRNSLPPRTKSQWRTSFLRALHHRPGAELVVLFSIKASTTRIRYSYRGIRTDGRTTHRAPRKRTDHVQEGEPTERRRKERFLVSTDEQRNISTGRSSASLATPYGTDATRARAAPRQRREEILQLELTREREKTTERHGRHAERDSQVDRQTGRWRRRRHCAC